MSRNSSVQKKLQKVRPPRVQMTYDVEIGDAIENKELPLVVGVVGDFGGNSEVPQKRLKERSFVGIPRTRPATDSRYDLRIADPPVMIMAVRAAPSSVPATPKREVTKEAPVAASPAAMTWFGLTVEFALLSLTN